MNEFTRDMITRLPQRAKLMRQLFPDYDNWPRAVKPDITVVKCPDEMRIHWYSNWALNPDAALDQDILTSIFQPPLRKAV
jgi:hypothetical protein